MGYSKIVITYIVPLLFSTVVFAQQPVGFGGSIPRTQEQLVPSSRTISSVPMTMAVRTMQMHLDDLHWISVGEEGILGLTRTVQSAIVLDIVSLLDTSVDKAETLSSYMSDVQDLLDRANFQSDQSTLRIGVFTEGLSACLVDKKLADSDFFQAINDNDDMQANLALSASLDASACATDFRVKANGLQAQYDKLAFYTRILQKKYDYISLQEDNIIAYYAVLRPALLKDLTTIASELQSFVLTH